MVDSMFMRMFTNSNIVVVLARYFLMDES
jgi:hypothetical protein